jgi:hypothetical protein
MIEIGDSGLEDALEGEGDGLSQAAGAGGKRR